jgi:hypothetical protein
MKEYRTNFVPSSPYPPLAHLLSKPLAGIPVRQSNFPPDSSNCQVFTINFGSTNYPELIGYL